jgi:hypothetical protein
MKYSEYQVFLEAHIHGIPTDKAIEKRKKEAEERQRKIDSYKQEKKFVSEFSPNHRQFPENWELQVDKSTSLGKVSAKIDDTAVTWHKYKNVPVTVSFTLGNMTGKKDGKLLTFDGALNPNAEAIAKTLLSKLANSIVSKLKDVAVDIEEEIEKAGFKYKTKEEIEEEIKND